MRPSILVWSLAIAVAALIMWAQHSIIDESTRASGTVIASSRVQVIQSVDGGVLEQLRVHEGDRVRKGEVLAVFDETARALRYRRPRRSGRRNARR